ncbi:hypothetical protein N8I77_002069 [Diaporthe amygdali]|uniref:F-box domain-containing protein n=1 Tax=Phomopsis amygdali TaxID=1214568 RepID=A0AAD9WBF9_PHOAM|nr:hypothetical protein N8I77_002069 [Diaporthe amygdali]
MDPVDLTPESRRTHLYDIRKQLDNLDSTQQIVKVQIETLEGGSLEVPIGKLRLVSLKLTEAQSALREVFGSLARPLLRPLTIYDLPDELLTATFLHLRNPSDIKRLRLSSRRLNETSSHLLLHTFYVSPNPKSLERLDEMSRHPAISKGLRRLIVSVDSYNVDIARSVGLFTIACIQELDRLRDVMPRDSPRFREFAEIRRSWVAFTESLTEDYDDGTHINVHHVNALYNGYLRYHNLFQEQQAVFRRDSFPQAIASAIGRMNRLDDLVIKDRSHSCDDSELSSARSRHRLANLAIDPIALVEDMMLHTVCWQKARVIGIDNPLTKLLYEIPLAIHQAGSSLAHLKFDLTPPHIFELSLDSDRMSQLESFAQSLQSFKFGVRAEPQNVWRPSRGQEENMDLSKFLTAFMRSPKLDSMALDFAFQERDCLEDNRMHDPDRTSIGPLVISIPSPELQNIHLKNCSLHLRDLHALIDHLSSGQVVLGLWYVYLLSGTWADVVELLRDAVLRGTLSPKSVSSIHTQFSPF